MNRANRILRAAWIGLGIAALGIAGASFAADSNSGGAGSGGRATQSYADRYSGLAEHNIFSRERPVKPKVVEAPKATPTQPVRTPESSLVLHGVVIEDEMIRAYIEDTSTGKTLKLSPGDLVGRGRIADISIDSVDYEHNGEELWISLGCDFTGKQVVTLTDSATATTGPVETIDPTRTDLTLEEKLKLRRQQERSH